MHETLTAFGLAKAPNKTYIGRITNGFSWLGYHFGKERLGLALTTWERFAARIGWLYEQGADTRRIGRYVQHWLRWVQALGHPGVWLGSIHDKASQAEGFLALCRFEGNWDCPLPHGLDAQFKT